MRYNLKAKQKRANAKGASFAQLQANYFKALAAASQPLRHNSIAPKKAAIALQAYFAAIYNNGSAFCPYSIFDLIDAQLDCGAFFACACKPALMQQISKHLLRGCIKPSLSL